MGIVATFIVAPPFGFAEVSQPLRIPRPVPAAQPMFSYSDEGMKQFAVWLREYKNPTVCPVYFCHGGCASGDLPCPSFLGKRVLDPQSNELMMSGSCCGGPQEMMSGKQEAMDCCK